MREVIGSKSVRWTTEEDSFRPLPEDEPINGCTLVHDHGTILELSDSKIPSRDHQKLRRVFLDNRAAMKKDCPDFDETSDERGLTVSCYVDGEYHVDTRRFTRDRLIMIEAWGITHRLSNEIGVRIIDDASSETAAS